MDCVCGLGPEKPSIPSFRSLESDQNIAHKYAQITTHLYLPSQHCHIWQFSKNFVLRKTHVCFAAKTIKEFATFAI